MSRPTTSATASRGRGHFAARYASRTTASQRVAASIEQIEFEACLPYRPFALRSAAPAPTEIPSIEEEDHRRPRSARLTPLDSAASLDAQEPFPLSFAAPASPLQLRQNSSGSSNDYIYNDEHQRSGSDVRLASASRERSVSPGSLWRRSRSTDRTDLTDLLCSSSESEESHIVSAPVSRPAAAAKRSPGVSPSSSFRAPLSPTLEARQEEAVVPTLPFARRPSASVSRSPSTGSYGLTRASSSYALETSLSRRVSASSSVNGSEAGATSPRVTARRLSSIYATTVDAPTQLRRKSSARSSAETLEVTFQPLAALSTTPRSPAAAAQSGNLSKIFVADKATRRLRSNSGPPALLRTSTAVAAPSLVKAQAAAPLSPTRKSTASLAILHVERAQNAAVPASPKEQATTQSIEIKTAQQEVADVMHAIGLPSYSSPQETLYGSRPPVPSPQRTLFESSRLHSDSDSSGITLASDSTVPTPLDSGAEEEEERPSRSRVSPALKTVTLRTSRSRSRGRTAYKPERRRFVKQVSTPLPQSPALGLLDAATPIKDVASAWPSVLNEAHALPLYTPAPGKPARKHLSASPALAPVALGFAHASRRGSLTPRAGSTTPADSVRSTPTLGKRALPLLHDVEELVVALSSGSASRRGSAATEEHERFVRARMSLLV